MIYPHISGWQCRGPWRAAGVRGDGVRGGGRRGTRISCRRSRHGR